MSKFLTPLICEKVEGTKDQWQLHEPLIYQSDLGGTITVPSGYKTDFASTPQFAWALSFTKNGLWDDIAVVHDFLYGNKIFSRKKCDNVFLEGLKDLGVPAIQAYPMYWAVRIFGKKFYDGAPTS